MKHGADLPGQSHQRHIVGSARHGQSDLEVLQDAAGPWRHHHHPVGQHQCLRNIMGDEDNGLVRLHPDALQQLVHVLTGLRVQ